MGDHVVEGHRVMVRREHVSFSRKDTMTKDESTLLEAPMAADVDD
jgi:hypothetical protein